MEEEIRLKIPGDKDRERMLIALGNSGYKVWVENIETDDGKSWKSEFHVVFKLSTKQ